METIDRAWHTAADNLKHELAYLQSAQRQWINQSGSEPMSGVQGKGTITDPYDGGNRDVQPGAPAGHQNTGRSVDLSAGTAESGLYTKGTMEQSYTSYKTGGTGGSMGQFSYSGGIPEQRSSHTTTSGSGLRDTAAGSGSGMTGLSSKSAGRDSTTIQASGTASSLSGTSRSGISQGSGTAAGGSGIKSNLAQGSGSGSGVQTHLLSTDIKPEYKSSWSKGTVVTRGSGIPHAYERAGLGELGQKSSFGGYTTLSATKSTSADKSYHSSGIGGLAGIRDTTGTTSSGGSKAIDQTSGMMGTSRDTTKSYDQGLSTTSTTRGSGLNDSLQGYKDSGTTARSGGLDYGYDPNSSMMGATRDTSMRDTTKRQPKTSGLEDSTNQSWDIAESYRGSDMTGTARDFASQGSSTSNAKDSATTKTFESYPSYQSTRATGASRDLGHSHGYNRAMGQAETGDLARSSGLKDTTTESTALGSGYQGSDMKGTARDSTRDVAYDKSQMDQISKPGNMAQQTSLENAGAKPSGLGTSNQNSSMTDTARNKGLSDVSKSDLQHIAVGDIAKKAGLGAGCVGLAAGVGSAISGASGSSGMAQGYQKSGYGQKSQITDMSTNRSGLGDSSTSRSTGLDSAYQGSNVANFSRDQPDLAQKHYTSGAGGMGQASTIGETTTSKGSSMGPSYQSTNISGTTRDSGLAQGTQGSDMGNMGPKSTLGDTATGQSRDLDPGYGNSGVAKTTGDSSLSQGYSQDYSRAGLGETSQKKNLGDLDTSGLGQGTQDTGMKETTKDTTTSSSPTGRKPSLIEKAKRKIGLGSSDEKSTTTGDQTKSGLDQGYEKSGLKDEPSADQAYQKTGGGDQVKSTFDEGYQGQGSGMKETSNVSPTSREIPQSGYQDTSKSTMYQEQGYGKSGLDTTESTNLAGASKPSMSQGYQSSGMQDTSRRADTADTSRSGMEQGHHSSVIGGTNTTPTMPGSYDSYGTSDISRGTDLEGASRSGVGQGYSSSGMKHTASSGMGQGYQSTGSGLYQSAQTGAGDTYGSSGIRNSSEGVGLADTTKSGMGQGYHSTSSDRSGMGNVYDNSGIRDSSSTGLSDTTKSGMSSGGYQGLGTREAEIGDTMEPTIAEEEEPELREIRVPSTITTPRYRRSSVTQQQSGTDNTAKTGPIRAYRKSSAGKSIDSVMSQGRTKSGASQGYSQSGISPTMDTGVDQRYQSSGVGGASGSRIDQEYTKPGIDRSNVYSGTGTTADRGLGRKYYSSDRDITSESAMDHGYENSSLNKGYNQSGIASTTGTGTNQRDSSLGLGQASGSAVPHTCPTCGMDQSYNRSSIGASTSNDKGQNNEQSYIGENVKPGVDSQHGKSYLGSSSMSGTDHTQQMPDASRPTQSGLSQGYQSSNLEQRYPQAGIAETSQTGMSSSQGYQRSTGMGESTEPGMHALNQDYQQSGIGETTRSGMDQGYQKSEGLGSGTTGQAYRTTANNYGQSGQHASTGEQRTQNYSSGNSSKPTTTAGGSKVSEEALKGPQCPARDPYDFEKAIDNPGRKGTSSVAEPGTNSGTTTKQGPSMGKAQKQNTGPLDQMKVKFEKVIHPKK